MGLLDWADENPALLQGLLAGGFGALAGRGTRMQAIGQGGIAGLLGYNHAINQQQDAAKEAEAAKFRDLQYQQMEGLLGDQQQSRKQRQMDQSAFAEMFSPKTPQQALEGGGGPTVANAAQIGQMPQFDPRQMFTRGASPEAVSQAVQFNQAMNPRAKIKEYREIRMPDGNVSVVGFDEFGQPVNTNQQPFKAPEVRDFGGYVGGIDPITGKVTNFGGKSVSPDAALSSATARRGQDMTDAREREMPRGVLDPERGLLVNPRTGEAMPVTMGGQPVGVKMSPEQRKEIMSINQQRSAVSAAIDAVKKAPSAFGIGRGVAGGTQIGESVAGRFESPAETQARAYVFNNVSRVINERAGAAQSAQELARLNQFLPAPTDNSEQIVNKLNGYLQYLGDVERGTRKPASDVSAPPPPVADIEELLKKY